MTKITIWGGQHMARGRPVAAGRVRLGVVRWNFNVGDYIYIKNKFPARKTSKHKLIDMKDWETPKNISKSVGLPANRMEFENMPKNRTVMLRRDIDMAEVYSWAHDHSVKIKYVQDVMYEGATRKAAVLRSVHDAIAFKLKWS